MNNVRLENNWGEVTILDGERIKAGDFLVPDDSGAIALLVLRRNARNESGVYQAMEDLIGPDILLTNSIFRIKEPTSATHYGWHQDAARIQVEPKFVIAYLAIGDATAENGCLRVIPGSHQRIEPFHLVAYADRQVARVTDVDEERVVDLNLNKGQVGLFSCNTIHGSGPNRSSQRRFALINDYTSAVSKQSVGVGSGQLVRGSNRWERWGGEPVPIGSFTADNIQNRRNALRDYPENVLMGPLAPGASPSFADGPPIP